MSPVSLHPQAHFPGISPRIYLQHHILETGRCLSLLVLRVDSNQKQDTWKGHLVWTFPYYHRLSGLSLFLLLSWNSPSSPGPLMGLEYL